MSNEESVAVTVHIQGKEYRIACPKSEQNGLRASAMLLDDKMGDIRTAGKIIGSERIAVMAALNIAHELLQYKSGEGEYNEFSGPAVKQLQDKLESALNSLQQMEL